MGFTTAAFIRRNTPELRKKLEELGYRLSGAELNEDLCIFTEPEYGLYSVEFFSNIPHPDETDSVDCGNNEDKRSYEPRRQQPTGGMYEGSHESGIPGHQRRDKVMGLFPV